jgi:ABC-2 type transport system ATP-binding protein
VIELSDVVKRYGRFVAVDRLSLRVERGELFAFLGPNGAGKTTTLKMIVGLLRPDSGSVTIDGQPLRADSLALRAQLGYVPDRAFLYDKLTGREFLRFVGDVFRVEAAARDREIARLAETFQMTEFLDSLAESFSHGMRQRLSFAAALLHRPRALVVDEPMVGLDPVSARILKRVLRDEVAGGTSVFLSTHSLDVAEEVADRIGILSRGRLLATGTLDELRTLYGVGSDLETLFLRAIGLEAGP